MIAQEKLQINLIFCFSTRFLSKKSYFFYGSLLNESKSKKEHKNTQKLNKAQLEHENPVHPTNLLNKYSIRGKIPHPHTHIFLARKIRSKVDAFNWRYDCVWHVYKLIRSRFVSFDSVRFRSESFAQKFHQPPSCSFFCVEEETAVACWVVVESQKKALALVAQ